MKKLIVVVFFDSIPCSEAFKDVSVESVQTEFEVNGPWFCPKMDEYKLLKS